MSDVNQEPDQDDFEVEISDVPPNGANGRHPATRIALKARLSRRARVHRILVIISAFVALVIVLVASLPELRNPVVGLVTRFIPTPTATLPPGADRLYLSADIPWTTVTLDGQPIRLPQRIGVDAPLQLARGHHILAWHAAPFLPQQCSFDVPLTPESSCPVIDEVRQGKAGPLAWVVVLHESLDTLPTAQQQALIQAAQAALSGFSDIVQPGEAYLSNAGNPYPNESGTEIATQPLRATLDLQLDTGTADESLCVLNLISQETFSCAIEGQDCASFCTVPWQARQAEIDAPDGLEWLTFAAMAPASWEYASKDGQVIAQNQPVGPNGVATRETLLLLRITWDDSVWKVQPLFGPGQGSPISVDDTPVTDDPACLPAEDFLFGQGIGVYQYRFVSGPNPAVGCLVEGFLNPPPAGATPPPNAPVAYWLMRFGIILAVNAMAQRIFPPSLLADAYERQLAQQLAALPGGLTVTPP